AQQADILPSLVALTPAKDTLLAFGRNLFDSTSQAYAVNYLSGIYQMLLNDTLTVFNGQYVTETYDLLTDPQLKQNLAAKELTSKNQENTLKAIIQQYNNRLIFNNLKP
ncbi:MAG TPA: hypothetical protein PK855_06455, partial [Bacteroidales bacterium]|nr:hypothetical protein [Bacteroidales bacterium]